MKYGYYTPDWLRVPKCMELTLIQLAVDLGYKSKEWPKLEEENEEDRKPFFMAQRDHRS